MPKTVGPLLSIAAHGTLAGTLTFRRHRSGTVATRTPRPTGPPSIAQQSHRAIVASIASAYRAASTADKQSWHAYADPLQLPVWPAMCSFNLARLRAGKAITTVYPPSTGPAIDMHLHFVFWKWIQAIQIWINQSQLPDPDIYTEVDPATTPQFDQQREQRVYYDNRRPKVDTYRQYIWDDFSQIWMPESPALLFPDWPARDGEYDGEKLVAPTWL
jgi:hypothetical protein